MQLTRFRAHTWFFIALLSLATFGCASSGQLVTAPSADEVAGVGEGARDQVEGVDVVARAQSWTGSRVVTSRVTPIHVRIENDSGEPLEVRYRSFALVSPEGSRYSVLPPFKVDGEAGEFRPAAGWVPVTAPAFHHHGFHVAPFYSSFYPHLTVARHALLFDSFHYDHYWGYWEMVELPTETMLEEALPEGVLEDGGEVEGFLYFEPVDEQVAQVTFRADLVSAENGKMFGEARIPFLKTDG